MVNLNQRPIAFYPVYAQIAGSINAGLLLSQLLYWHSAVNGREFYKTDIEISNETYLSEKELRNAKARLKALPFVKIEARGIPRVTYYDFDLNALALAISDYNPTKGRIQYRQKGDNVSAEKAVPVTPKGRNSDRRKGVIYTENTQKNTTQITQESTNPKKEKHDELVKTKKTKNLQDGAAAASGLDCLTDPDFIREMEDWTAGIIQVTYELEKMRDWLASSGKKYKDYKAFARNWIRRACEAKKRDWDAQQPERVGLNQQEINEVLLDLQRKKEERARMGLV